MNATLKLLEASEARLKDAARALQLEEERSANAQEALRIKNLELRQLKAETDDQKTRLESVNEDLRSEVQQLQEIQETSDARCVTLSQTIDNLRSEIQSLRGQNSEIELPIQQSINASQGTSNGIEGLVMRGLLENAPTEPVVEELRQQIGGLEETNAGLRRQLSQTRAEKASIMTTLHGVSSMIESVVSMESREEMEPTLQGVLGTLKGALGSDTRTSTQLAGRKRGRTEEEGSEGDVGNAPKRRRQTGSADVTDEN